MKRALIWIAAALLALGMCQSAMAAEVDLSRSGSIILSLSDAGGAPAAGGVYRLYRVGEPVLRNSQLCFELTRQFSGSGIFLQDPSASHLAELLSGYARNQSLTPLQERTADKNGRAAFTDVPCGLYLVLQKEPGKEYGFERMTAFVAAVPMTGASGKGWSYEVTAQPKVERKSAPTPTPRPGASKPPYDSRLPQTGMLLWPIPVLSAAGIVLFVVGWLLCFTREAP